MPFLMASASKDRSVRLWNIETESCIATFHGDESHRDEVITVAFNHDCSKLASGGLDHMIAIWDLTVPEIVSAIAQSKEYNRFTGERAVKTVFHPFPWFKTRRVHKNYVDCVEWFGDFILSKVWRDNFTQICKFGSLENCDYYFMRFATNNDRTILAVGSINGDVRLWNLDVADPKNNMPTMKLKHARRKTVVRDLSFSRCGRDLVFCSDDGSIWLYQHKSTAKDF